MTVLVLTRDLLDPIADLVISKLNERNVPVVRLDPGDFPEALSISASLGPGGHRWQGVLRGRHRDLSLADIHAVYYRRPTPFRFDPRMPTQDTEWSHAEARAGFGGTLATLDCLWVNHPKDNTRAGRAPAALSAAVRCGLAVPRTLITNNPSAAREFVRAIPGAVAAYKAIGHFGPSTHDGTPHALWTTQVHPEEIDDSVARTAHLFQEWIPKAYEVRVTAVDQQLFAAEIHAGNHASRIDFRADYDSLTYKVCAVPGNIAHGIRALMANFGLRYVAIDFLVSSNDGHWYLVDVNPNGQFGFIPELRDPIANALARLLEGHHA